MKKTMFIMGLVLAGMVLVMVSPPAYTAEQIMTKPMSTGPVRVNGRQLEVDFDGNGQYEPYLIKGVGYSPYPIGTFPSEWGTCEYIEGSNPPQFDCNVTDVYDRPELMDRDFPLIVSMNANTIRTWGSVTPTLLNKANQYGLRVCAGYWIDYTLNITDPNVRRQIKDDFSNYVNSVITSADYSTLLMWVIGNENNKWHQTPQKSYWYSLLDELAQIAYNAEVAYHGGQQNYHPTATANAEIQDIGISGYGSTDGQMTYLDIWGINVYRGQSFGDLFTVYATKSNRPLLITEYGVDAWNNANGNPYPATQAQWDGAMWDDLVGKDVCIGGSIMEYCDEWWKQDEWTADVTTQDYEGSALAGAAPDGFLNEEWWGIMSIADNPVPSAPDIMQPREVYETLQKRFQCNINTPHYAGPGNGKSCDGSSACCSSETMKAKNGVCVSGCGGNPCPCFVAGTPILLADGTLKPIQKVKAGDLVMSFDEKAGKLKQDKVKETFKHKTDKYLIVNGHLKVTENHPVYSNDEWIEIGKLKIGDKLTDSKGKPETIVSIKEVKKKVSVYNLEVNPYHTYIAGGILVHNKPAPGSCLQPQPAAQ